jgi:predicted transposase YdaD
VSGVYLLHRSSKAAIVALNQVPATEATLLLRILGKGQTQKQAVDEVIAFEREDPKRSAILKMLANWKISVEVTGPIEAEEELMMVLTQAYLEWEQQTEQRGRQEGRQEGALSEAQALILRLLTRRISTLTPVMQAQVQSLSLNQLELLGEALLDFSQPDDLVGWLRSHS